jgi:hypothetical protein
VQQVTLTRLTHTHPSTHTHTHTDFIRIHSWPHTFQPPFTHTQYKKPYRVHMEQFPPNAKLHLQIIGVPQTAQGLSALGTGAPMFKKTIAGSASGLGMNPLVTDADGNVDVRSMGWAWLDCAWGDVWALHVLVLPGRGGGGGGHADA